MKRPSVRNRLGALLVGALLCPLHLNAQIVYVNDNNPLFAANSATGYSVIPGPALAVIGGSPFGTFSTGNGVLPAPVQEVAASISGSNCLFVSDPIGNTGNPNGDVAAFTIGPGGVLTLVGLFNDPSDTSGPNHVIPLAIDRRPGFPYFFAAFQAENKIAFFKVGPNCQLFWSSSTNAIGLNGGSVMSMAVSRMGPPVLVVAYGDGSIQSFAIGSGILTPTQPPFNSTGFGSNGGLPESVDITHNGMWAVFGDNQSSPFAEVEVAHIMPSGALAPTVDYAPVGSGFNSRNVWLSPGGAGGIYYLYITNNSSGQVTTARINQTNGVLFAAGTCTGLYTNPTLLAALSWVYPAGLHTTNTTGSGVRLVVAEDGVGSPSSVALLKIQGSSGCTKEATGSPFLDPNSGYLESIDVFPSRSY